jgi:hypothetical protein
MVVHRGLSGGAAGEQRRGSDARLRTREEKHEQQGTRSPRAGDAEGVWQQQ